MANNKHTYARKPATPAERKLMNTIAENTDFVLVKKLTKKESRKTMAAVLAYVGICVATGIMAAHDKRARKELATMPIPAIFPGTLQIPCIPEPENENFKIHTPIDPAWENCEYTDENTLGLALDMLGTDTFRSKPSSVEGVETWVPDGYDFPELKRYSRTVYIYYDPLNPFEHTTAELTIEEKRKFDSAALLNAIRHW